MSRVDTRVMVYTGTFGLLYLPGTDNQNHPIYLYTQKGNQYLPAPLYFWKVLHNPVSSQAVAFMGLNNPYVTQSPKLKCQNVCDHVSFVDWDLNDFDAGFMYCCRVEDLRKEVEYVPDLRNENGQWPDLLTSWCSSPKMEASNPALVFNYIFIDA